MNGIKSSWITLPVFKGCWVVTHANHQAWLFSYFSELDYQKEIFQKKPRTADLNKQKGGEAICFQRNQHNFITMYDMGKEKSPIHLYRLKKSKK